MKRENERNGLFDRHRKRMFYEIWYRKFHLVLKNEIELK